MPQTKQKVYMKNFSVHFLGTILVLPVSAKRPFPYFAIGFFISFCFNSASNRSKPQSFSPSKVFFFVSISTVVTLNFNTECLYFVDTMLIPEFLS